MTNMLIISPMNPMLKIALENRGVNGVRITDLGDPIAWLDENGAGIEQVLTDGHFGLQADYLERMPNLKIISSNGVGYDAIDTAATNARNIVVTNTPGVLSEDVATIGLLLLLSCYRNFRLDLERAHSGQWTKDGNGPLARSPENRTIGIVGLGRIGQAMARKLAPFNPTIVYHGRSKKDVPFAYYADLKEMASACDAMICITPGGAETRHIINAEVMEALGPEGVLVNIGRGSVVDEAALIEALQSGKLGAAGLDVFENEPTIPEALRNHPRATLTPHVASATMETRQAMAQLAVDNLESFTAKGTVHTPVPECQHFVKQA